MKDLAIPTPRALYIFGDLPGQPQSEPPANERTEKLLDLIRKNAHVVLLNNADQIQTLALEKISMPFPMTLAIGEAGYRVAQELHGKTGWFPKIRMIHVARQERMDGSFRIVVTSGPSLKHQVNGYAVRPVAIVDDTIYSGLTVTTIVKRLPEFLRNSVHIFALQGIGAAVKHLRYTHPVSVAKIISGRRDIDASIIRLSHIYTKNAIRLTSGEELAFYERRQWMQAWFPKNWQDVIACAQAICPT